MNNYRIYVAFHQAGKVIPDDSIYTPLQVGKKVSHIELEMINDATGENISEKNNIYSELTGWYWIWKNTKHDIVGTSHYRRYFTVENPSLVRKIGKFLLFLIGQKQKRQGLFYVRSEKLWKNSILSMEQAKELMSNYDIVVPHKKKFRYTVHEQYKRRHKEVDILITRQIIKEKHPDYTDAFDKTFASKEMYPFNMFIMPWEMFENYMKWLFSILFELEKRADIDFTDNYQKRVCAFMAERLQTVWLNKNKPAIKELYVLYFKKKKAGHF